MITPFFVTGLPRSRSAWLAAWLTTEETLCYHDVEFDASLLRFDRRVGFAGSELVWSVEELSERFPGAPWLFVLRDPAKCLESWKRVAGPHLPTGKEFHRLWIKRIDAITAAISGAKRSCSCIALPFQALDEEGAARDVWQHLIGSPFDFERWKLFTEFNIQQKFEQVLKSRTEEKPWPS